MKTTLLIKHTYFFLLFLTVVPQVFGQGDRENTILQTPYYDRLSLFESSPFDIGETKEYNSPFPEDFITLNVPTYKGIPRIGLLRTFEENKRANHQEYNKTRQERSATRDWQKQNLGAYLSLLTLDIMKDKVIPSDLADRFKFKDSPAKYDAYDGQYGAIHFRFQPRAHLEGLAAGTLTPERFEDFYCPEDVYCPAKELKRTGKRWGGNINEFQARKAFLQYLGEILPKLRIWAGQLSNEVYIVSAANMLPYDFAKKGYQISVSSPHTIAPFSGSALQYWPQNEDKAIMGYQGAHNLFVNLSADEAEKIDKRLTELGQTGHKQLFAVVKGKIYGLSRASRNWAQAMSYGSPVGFLFDVTDTKIEFYMDEALTEKAFESTLKL